MITHGLTAGMFSLWKYRSWCDKTPQLCFNLISIPHTPHVQTHSWVMPYLLLEFRLLLDWPSAVCPLWWGTCQLSCKWCRSQEAQNQNLEQANWTWSEVFWLDWGSSTRELHSGMYLPNLSSQPPGRAFCLPLRLHFCPYICYSTMGDKQHPRGCFQSWYPGSFGMC